jgi:hypothetical protein
LFKLEDYLSEREFTAEYMFCSSDMETHSVSDIVDMADAESRALWDPSRAIIVFKKRTSSISPHPRRGALKK